MLLLDILVITEDADHESTYSVCAPRVGCEGFV